MTTTCIVGVDQNRVLKDFVRAHVELLSGPKICVEHWYPDLTFEGRTIRLFYSSSPGLTRASKLLPHAIYNRLVARNALSPARIDDAITAFLRQKKVGVILAEFGTSGADIFPHAKQLGIPLVVHFHGHDAHRRSVVDEYRARYKGMFEYAFRIISVSHLMTAALIDLGADPAKVVYNPYGPRDKFFDIVPAYKSQTVLSVGRFTDIKANYLTLAAFRIALKEHPDAQLVMAGDGELLETCRTLASVWGIQANVSFPGAVIHDQVTRHYSAASIFAQHSVTPSYGDAEGTPVTILEAGAAGLPTISTRHAGIPDVVAHDETGYLIAERDVEEMGRRMSQLLGDETLRRKMGSNARERVRSHYSMSRHIRVLQELLDAASENREPRADVTAA